MKSFPLSKDALAIVIVALVTVGFFISGLFDILDYVAVKVLLFTSFSSLFVVALISGIKNSNKKNRPEDTLQDDSH